MFSANSRTWQIATWRRFWEPILRSLWIFQNIRKGSRNRSALVWTASSKALANSACGKDGDKNSGSYPKAVLQMLTNANRCSISWRSRTVLSAAAAERIWIRDRRVQFRRRFRQICGETWYWIRGSKLVFGTSIYHHQNWRCHLQEGRIELVENQCLLGSYETEFWACAGKLSGFAVTTWKLFKRFKTNVAEGVFWRIGVIRGIKRCRFAKAAKKEPTNG